MLTLPELKKYKVYFSIEHDTYIWAFDYKVYEGMIHFYNHMDGSELGNPGTSIKASLVDYVCLLDGEGNNSMEDLT